MQKAKRIICVGLGAIMTAAACAASVYFSKAVVNRDAYPVRGVDVSRYQGIINWQQLAEQDISFAFIKATEGSSHVDEFAEDNLEMASHTDLSISAYHFFSFDSPGETQAENFIRTVSKDSINMPPVIDIEYYGDKFRNKPTSDECTEILRPLLERLEEYYGVKPLIYTTLSAYGRYIKDEFADYPIWIRNVNFEPEFINWDFWQYSCTGELRGFVGEEKYIDLNVFNGTEQEFRERFAKGK